MCVCVYIHACARARVYALAGAVAAVCVVRAFTRKFHGRLVSLDLSRNRVLLYLSTFHQLSCSVLGLLTIQRYFGVLPVILLRHIGVHLHVCISCCAMLYWREVPVCDTSQEFKYK